MHIQSRFILLIIFLTITADCNADGWDFFGGDISGSSCSGRNINSLNYTGCFSPGTEVWEYPKWYSVWSPQAAVYETSENSLVYCGNYDHNLYCIEAGTGKTVFRYSTGGPLSTTPCIISEPEPVVVFSSSDRSIYCLIAENGKLKWSKELFPWSFSVFLCRFDSIISMKDTESVKIYAAVFHSDNQVFTPVQSGAVFCLDSRNGNVMWKKELCHSRLYGPVAVKEENQTLLFVTSENGVCYCLNSSDGELKWSFVASSEISSPPLAVQAGKRTLICFGTVFGLYYALDAGTGECVWMYKSGMNVLFPGAVSSEMPHRLLVPNLDRNLHCIDVETGKLLWKFMTGKYITSQPLVFRYKNEEVAAVTSQDNNLYILRVSDGKEVFRAFLGERIFAYDTRGRTRCSGPVPALYKNSPLLVVPWHDGKIHFFGQ